MMRGRPPAISLRWAMVGFLILSWQEVSESGLIIEVDPSIDIRTVSDLAIRRGNLIIRYSEGTSNSEIHLAPGVLERISLWAGSEARGPMVVSYDNVFVRGGAGLYYPPYIQKDLGGAFADYDAFAANLAVGFLPENGIASHPLVKRMGEAALPHRQYASLMDVDNKATSAVWYRHLAAQYILPPGCPEAGSTLAVIGEHTIRAVPAREGLPVRLEVISHRWMVPNKWYRGVNVPSEWDRWIAALPFDPLRKDIEEHWDEYRAAFKPLDELSSIVESYAILAAVRRQNESLWIRFRDRLMQGADDLEVPPMSATPEGVRLEPPPLPSEDDWLQLAVKTALPNIETTAQANLVLAFMAKGKLRKQSWPRYRPRIEALAENDLILRARLALVDALEADPKEEVLLHTRRFFEMTRGKPDLYRLRVQGLHKLRDPSASSATG